MHSHNLTHSLYETQKSKNAIIRELVLHHRRFDILAEFVLGYDPPQWFHEEMIDWQDSNQEGLLLAFRGARKTTYCTITRCIGEILIDGNIRILLGSDSFDQSKIFLREIKGHFEKNEKLREIFGDYYTGSEKWSESEIIVTKRTKRHREATVTCVGTGTQFVGRHFDAIVLDDFVTRDSSATEGLREKTHQYFYNTLYPCLESPHGRMWVIGTRWHHEDFYGHLKKHVYPNATLQIPILDEEEEGDLSIWEDKFPTARLHRLRAGNPGAFELQWMCRGNVIGDSIFLESHFQFYDELPHDVIKWQGVDLAISQKEQADFFAHVTIAVQKGTSIPYLVNFRKRRIPYTKQPKFVADRWYEHPDVLGVGSESNQYQDALRQDIRKDYPDVPVIGIWTNKDKILRANQRTILLSDKPLHIRKQHTEFKRLLLGFPSLKGSKDVFDALDMALRLGLRGKKKRRRNEPGLI